MAILIIPGSWLISVDMLLTICCGHFGFVGVVHYYTKLVSLQTQKIKYSKL